MQKVHEFLKIKHGDKHGHVQNIHMLFVTEAERRLQALFPAPRGLSRCFFLKPAFTLVITVIQSETVDLSQR